MSDGLVPRVPSALKELGRVEVALIMGSGLSSLVDDIEDATAVPFADIEGFPVPETPVPGHNGRLIIGTFGGKRVAAFQGRIHCYEGFSASEVAFPVRLAAALGAGTLIVTNAAGAVDSGLASGDIVLISDHINLACANPLIGWSGFRGGTPFVSLHDAYDSALRTLAIQASIDTGVSVVTDGVYAWQLGPTYETPAEVAMLRMLGADVVGMSTVPEVIVARALGMKVLGMSLVTNEAGETGLVHDEVLGMGHEAAQRMRSLVLAILQRLS
jgi:purine-nucleoside phosphorylase